MEEESKDSSIKSTIEAATALVKAVPIYNDALQPGARQVGKSLETVGKAVNMALAPLKVLVWGYDLIEEWLTKRVNEKLKGVPQENIITPSPQVAGPTIEALRYVANDTTLRELYANLLATAMNSERLDLAHPGYVEILKNMSTDEAILLGYFLTKESYPTIDVLEHLPNSQGYHTSYTNFTNWHESTEIKRVDLIPTYIDNLCRLGILEQPFSLTIIDPQGYKSLKESHLLNEIQAGITRRGNTIQFKDRVVRLTSLGRNFVNNVVKNP